MSNHTISSLLKIVMGDLKSGSDQITHAARKIFTTSSTLTDGASLVSKANEAFKRIDSASSKVVDFVEEVAASSKEQALGFEQISISMMHLEKITQQNSSDAESSAVISENLYSQAEKLNLSIERLLMIVGKNGVGGAGNEYRQETSSPKRKNVTLMSAAALK